MSEAADTDRSQRVMLANTNELQPQPLYPAVVSTCYVLASKLRNNKPMNAPEEMAM